MKRPAAAAIALLIASIASAAQAPVRPPRDLISDLLGARGAAIVAGRVTDAQTGAPLRRATIRLMGPRDTRETTTDEDGRFELSELAAGRWELTASKAGYITRKYGQSRAFGRSTPVDLSNRRVTADVALIKASAITGRVYDEFGEPITAAHVKVMRARIVKHRRYLEPVGAGDFTDDTGSFRVYGLPAGEYYVTASLRVAPIDSVQETTFEPTYYPGTGRFADAQRVFVPAGKDVSLTFPLLPVVNARISGTVIASTGAPGDAFISLTSEAGEFGHPLGLGGITDEDGSFTLSDIPPGDYTLVASLKSGNISDANSEVASVQITVDGVDVSGLSLVTAKPATVRGRIVADAGVTRPLPPKINLVGRSVRAGGEATYAESERNTFEMTMVAGPLILDVDVPDGWQVKSIDANGADVPPSAAVDFLGQQNVPVRIVLTDRLTEVAGMVTGTGAAGATVVVFPADAAKWTGAFIRSALADARGTFRVTGMPTGLRYLAVAVDDVDEGEGEDPDFLRVVQPFAVPVDLGAGDKHAIELPLVHR